MSGFMALNLDFLRALAAVRTPLLNGIMAAVTHLGEETFFMLLALLFLWCIDKRRGYYLLLVGFTGTILNQMLKITFCIPRPWVLDPSFSIVEAARAQATGFSFPSGHTQNAVGTFGGIAYTTKRRSVRIVCIILALLIAFSRLYLGVHTPLDVGVSLLAAAALVFALAPVPEEAKRRSNYLLHVWMLMLLPALIFLLYALHVRSGSSGDLTNFNSAVKNAWCMLGGVAGIILTIFLDERFLRFETQAVWWAQLIKLTAGLGLVVAVRAGLKAPLYALLGQGSGPADGIRYFCMVLAAGVLWPLSFHFFSTLGHGKGRALH